MFDFYMRGMLEYEDDINILTANQKYSDNISEPIEYSYDFSDLRLTDLREKYKLEKIAGNGNDFTKLSKLTFWIANTLRFGTSDSTESFHALDVIEKTQKGFKSNCFVVATVLAECFLSMGYIARMVRCMPIDLRFDDCHCMTIAYLNNLKKFIAFDATVGGFYVDKHGKPMSIPDIRTAVIERREFKVRGIFNNTNDNYIKNISIYLSKNLVRFQSHKNMMYGNAISNHSDVMINLNPISLPLKNKTSVYNEKTTQHIFTYNSKLFWEDNVKTFAVIRN